MIQQNSVVVFQNDLTMRKVSHVPYHIVNASPEQQNTGELKARYQYRKVE